LVPAKISEIERQLTANSRSFSKNENPTEAGFSDLSGGDCFKALMQRKAPENPHPTYPNGQP
jgi:hypothetical protein